MGNAYCYGRTPLAGEDNLWEAYPLGRRPPFGAEDTLWGGGTLAKRMPFGEEGSFCKEGHLLGWAMPFCKGGCPLRMWVPFAGQDDLWEGHPLGTRTPSGDQDTLASCARAHPLVTALRGTHRLPQRGARPTSAGAGTHRRTHTPRPPPHAPQAVLVPAAGSGAEARPLPPRRGRPGAVPGPGAGR